MKLFNKNFLYFCRELDLATILVTGLDDEDDEMCEMGIVMVEMFPEVDDDAREIIGSFDRSRSLMLMVLTGILTESFLFLAENALIG